MSTKKLDLTKPVQTRDGRPVRVLCTDKEGTEYPVVGLIAEDRREHLACWPLDGTLRGGGWRDDDLVNVPPPKQVSYFNMYKGGIAGIGFPTRERADRAASVSFCRVACVRVEYTEGQFDE